MRDRASEWRANGSGELALIRRIRDRAAHAVKSNRISLGIGDDCALLALKNNEEAAITTDLSIQDRHFRLDLHPPESIGHRTLARGLSDIAAMGGRPLAAFLSLGLPPGLADQEGHKSWIDQFMDGLLPLAARHKTTLAGGDLAESPIALADIVVVGAVPQGLALLRSGAAPGDLLYVTGTLGGSAAGLRKLETLDPTCCTRRIAQPDFEPHLWPEPRISQGRWIRSRHVATAAIDVSDGLSTDLYHLCTESKVGAEIHEDLLPIFPGATLEDALHGGEDYELLFTARPGARIPRTLHGVPVTKIGTIVKARSKQPSVVIVDASGRRPLERKGWEHFRAGERLSY